jgi:hypothetical protein
MRRSHGEASREEQLGRAQLSSGGGRQLSRK